MRIELVREKARMFSCYSAMLAYSEDPEIIECIEISLKGLVNAAEKTTGKGLSGRAEYLISLKGKAQHNEIEKLLWPNDGEISEEVSLEPEIKKFLDDLTGSGLQN